VNVARALAVAALLVPGAPRAWEGSVRLEGGAGYDSNPLRVTGGSDAAAFGEVVVDARTSAADDRGEVRLALSEGARVFLGTPEANVLATRAEVAAAAAVGSTGAIGAALFLRDLSEQGGVRSESDGLAAATARLDVGTSRLRLSAGWSATWPRAMQVRPFAAQGPELVLAAALGLGRAQSLELAYAYRFYTYPRWTETATRADQTHTVSLDWMWRGPLVMGFGYFFAVNESSVPGGAYRRHHLQFRVAAPLPLGWAIALHGSLQRSIYPDGFYTDAQVLLAQGDEQQNAFELRLSRPLGDRAELVFKAGAYASELGSAGSRLPYDRQVAQVALGWRLE